MLRSMNSAVTGLKTHQKRMDVIGNNIANVNTTSYKSQSANFSDVLYQTTQNASGATETTGGVNPKQIGLGSIASSINANIDGQGSATTTNNPFDLMIRGDSFFVLDTGTIYGENPTEAPAPGGDEDRQLVFTRDGTFTVDGQGYLVTQSGGYYVQGWMPVENPETGEMIIDTDGPISRIRILGDETATFAPEATSEGVISGNIDAFDPNIQSDEGKIINIDFYDNLGYGYNARFAIKDVDNLMNTYTMTLVDIVDSNENSLGNEQLAMVNLTTQDDAGGAGNVPGILNRGVYLSDYNISAGTASYSMTDGNIESADPTVLTQVPIYGKLGDLPQEALALYNITLSDPPTPPIDDDNQVAFTTEDEYKINDLGNLTITHKGQKGEPTIEHNRNSLTLRYDHGTGDYAGATFAQPGGGTLDTDPLDKVKLNFDPDLASGNSAFNDINIDLSETTNYNSSKMSTARGIRGNMVHERTGRIYGTKSSITVSKDGKITASYTNGKSLLLGQIAVARFANASGLAKEGNNLYSATSNSGTPQIDDISLSGGSMQTGVLEASNVDLGMEFTNMITTQRGFQSNSRTITTSDQMLEEVMNLKR